MFKKYYTIFARENLRASHPWLALNNGSCDIREQSTHTVGRHEARALEYEHGVCVPTSCKPSRSVTKLAGRCEC